MLVIFVLTPEDLIAALTQVFEPVSMIQVGLEAMKLRSTLKAEFLTHSPHIRAPAVEWAHEWLFQILKQTIVNLRFLFFGLAIAITVAVFGVTTGATSSFMPLSSAHRS